MIPELLVLINLSLAIIRQGVRTVDLSHREQRASTTQPAVNRAKSRVNFYTRFPSPNITAGSAVPTNLGSTQLSKWAPLQASKSWSMIFGASGKVLTQYLGQKKETRGKDFGTNAEIYFYDFWKSTILWCWVCHVYGNIPDYSGFLLICSEVLTAAWKQSKRFFYITHLSHWYRWKRKFFCIFSYNSF